MKRIALDFNLEKIRTAVGIVLGALLLLSHALYNGYPLIYPDTGTYIAACFDRFVPIDRPLTYSFFLRHSSLSSTLWLPIIFQCLIVSWIILLLFRHLAEVKKPFWWHIVTIFILALTTGIAVNTDQLIADVFTSVIVMTSALLLFSQGIPKLTRITLGIILTFSITTHMSHYPMYCAIVASGFVVWFFIRKKSFGRALIGRLFRLSICIPAAIIFTVALNFSVGHEWKFSPGCSHIFMMNRLIQTGILDQYLDANCGRRPSTLCTYRDGIYGDFLWDENSALNRHYKWSDHGWAKAKPEYDSIISEVFNNKEYVKQYITADLRDAAIQLMTFHVVEMRVQLSGSAPYETIKAHFPNELNQYVAGKQAQGKLLYNTINRIQEVMIAVCCFLLLILLLLYRKLTVPSPKVVALTGWIVISMIFNALTVVSVAMIDGRYQARLIWLIPLVVALLVSHITQNKGWITLFGKRASKPNNSEDR